MPLENLIVQKYEWCETNQEFKLNNDRSYSEEEIERGENKFEQSFQSFDDKVFAVVG